MTKRTFILLTSGAGLPASTVQENCASSPSFTTSFSGVTLITGFTAKKKLVNSFETFDKLWKWLSFSSVWPRNPISPPQTSGWGKLIKEAGTSTSLLRVLPSLFQKYFRHIIYQFFFRITPIANLEILQRSLAHSWPGSLCYIFKITSVPF